MGLQTRPLDQHYVAGEEIHAGDRVSFGGRPATIVAVIGRGEYRPPFLAEDWDDYEAGFLLRTDEGNLFMYECADEDIVLISRLAEAE